MAPHKPSLLRFVFDKYEESLGISQCVIFSASCSSLRSSSSSCSLFTLSDHQNDDGDGGEGDDHAGGFEEDHLDLRLRPLILAKIWCLIVIFYVTFIAGV
ncbi:hypothetical protein K1719_042066 [Acacia pycnantha]|nr:hypothetical protein K1719_042066 [Acacia pycnantha]